MIGKPLNHYQILEQLGSGGMGDVYRARDTKLDRDVAIKILPADLAEDAERLARFEREAKLLAALNHPSVAAIYGLEEAGGIRFLVLELVHGETLERRLSKGPLPVEQAIEFCRQIAEALEVAHKQRIVHRDLKPANVIITPEGRAKVLDFGIAKVDRPSERNGQTAIATDLTAAGTLIGTAPYMSPEQVRGTTVDTLSDIWAFGCVLYEALAGKRVFARETVADTLAAILEVEPDWNALPEATPPAALALLRRCLRKDSDRRLHSIADARIEIEELQQRLFRLPEIEPPPDFGDAVMARVAQYPAYRRKRFIATAGASAALAVLIVGGVGLNVGGVRDWLIGGGPRTEPGPIESLAVLPVENLTGDPGNDYLAEGTTDELITELGQIGSLRVTSRSSVMQFKVQRPTLPEIGEELNVDGLIEASLLDFGERARVTLRLYHAATETPVLSRTYEREAHEVRSLYADAALEIAEEIGAALTPAERGRLARAPDVDPKVYEAYQMGRFFWNKRTGDDLETAIGYFEQALALDPRNAAAYAGLADCYVLAPLLSGLHPEAAFPFAEENARAALAIDDSVAEAHTALAYALMFYELDWEGAAQSFERALELNPSYATGHFHKAAYLASQGLTGDAVEAALRAQELDPTSPIINAGVAWMYHLGGDYENAILWSKRVLDLQPGFPIGHQRLGTAYDLGGRHAEAIEELNAAVETSGGNADWTAALGHAYAVSGDESTARAILDELTRRKESGEYVAAYNFAVVYAGLGEGDAAIEWLGRAHEERSWSIAFIIVDPYLEPLREHPGFRELVLRMGLPG